jgi:hypothetical protein
VLGRQLQVARVRRQHRRHLVAQRSWWHRVAHLEDPEAGLARGSHGGVVVRLARDQPADDAQRRDPAGEGSAPGAGAVRSQRHAGKRPARPRQHGAPPDAEIVEGGRHVGRPRRRPLG